MNPQAIDPLARADSMRQVANAPIPNPGGLESGAAAPGKQITAVRVVWALRNLVNPISWAEPKRVSWLLNALNTGDLSIAKLWDAVQRRDEILLTAINKRFDNVGRLDVQTIIPSNINEGQKSRAKQHQEALKQFWGGVTCTEALRQDVKGGVRLLAQQILMCRLQGWSVHEKVWQLPAQGKPLSMRFVHCPLYWFENRFGKLRYLPAEFDMYGLQMEEKNWLVSASPRGALMESCIVLWMFKHFATQDYASWLERYGQPVVDISTTAGWNTEEFENLVQMARDFGNEAALVHSPETTVGVVQPPNQTDPFQFAIEMLDRKLTMAVLHSDLQMQSREGGGNVGASVQQDEPMKQLDSDAEFVNSILKGVSNEVTQYLFGEDALAETRLVPPANKEIKQELSVIDSFARWGLPVDKDEVYEILGRKQPTPEDAVYLQSGAGSTGGVSHTGSAGRTGLKGDGSGDADPVAGELANVSLEAGFREGMELAENARDQIAKQLAEKLHPLRMEIARIDLLPTPEEKRTALLSFQDKLPEVLKSWGVDARIQRDFEEVIGTALVAGMTLD